jgi:hypothetical protein
MALGRDTISQRIALKVPKKFGSNLKLLLILRQILLQNYKPPLTARMLA